MQTMNKIIEIRKAVNAFLKSKHPRVYFEAAPKGAEYRYIVYDLPNSNDDGSMEQFILEIDGWDAPANKDTLPIEELMSLIDEGIEGVGGLHRKTISIPGLSMTFYRENRISLRDDNELIRRRKYVYQVRTHISR
jgi:hypothetical protein